MARWGVYIDTDTQAPQVTDGRVVVCSQAMSQVQHSVLTELGSVEDAEDYGSGVGEVEHISDSALRDMERRIDKALQSLVGPILYTFDRETTWNTDGYPQIEIAFTSPAGAETATYRLGR